MSPGISGGFNFGANSFLLTYFNMANELRGAGFFILAPCLALDQVFKENGVHMGIAG